MPLVAGAAAVLADEDLLPAPVLEDGRGHRRIAEQHDRLEYLAGARRQAVDDQRLAVANAMLLVTELDDCVIHGVKIRAR